MALALVTLMPWSLETPDSGGGGTPGPHRVAVVSGLQAPQSAVHDPVADVYFVSNLNGSGHAKDNRGFISVVSPEGRTLTPRFVEGGKAGVTLHCPRGLALSGDTLYVADLDAVRAFDRRTGALIRSVDLAPLGALFLSDVAIGPAGDVFVSDARRQFAADGGNRHVGPDYLFRVSADGRPARVFEGDLGEPDGLAWDASRGRLVVGSLAGPNVYEWKQGDPRASLRGSGVGGYDGLVLLSRGRLLVSSLHASGVYLQDQGKETVLITGLKTPADIGLDAKRNRLLVPSVEGNTLEIWQLPARLL